MNSFQLFYTIALAAILVLRPSKPAMVVAINAAATLAICLAMDLHTIVRSDATMLMMIADLTAGAALIFSPGLSRVVGLSFALTSQLHTLNLVFGVSNSTTFAILYVVNFVQLGMLSSGFGGRGYRFRRMLGRRDFSYRGLSSRRDFGMVSRRVASISELARK